ncbi:MAG: acylphosphatase [Candidatus Aenigmatarchaeota archaeon]|nr:MAG: acylphosphatase [Candidatus Aenigmarchaeota archaeon]
MKARAHVVVSGSVQGVFFRANTREKAHDLGLKGWVRNTHDGKVEAVFEGDKFAVLEAVDFCRQGPPGAHVKDIDVKWDEYKGEFGSFEVRY